MKLLRLGNRYHNNLHAADVLQTTHWFISQSGLKVKFSNFCCCVVVVVVFGGDVVVDIVAVADIVVVVVDVVSNHS